MGQHSSERPVEPRALSVVLSHPLITIAGLTLGVLSLAVSISEAPYRLHERPLGWQGIVGLLALVAALFRGIRTRGFISQSVRRADQGKLTADRRIAILRGIASTLTIEVLLLDLSLYAITSHPKPSDVLSLLARLSFGGLGLLAIIAIRISGQVATVGTFLFKASAGVLLIVSAALSVDVVVVQAQRLTFSSSHGHSAPPPNNFKHATTTTTTRPNVGGEPPPTTTPCAVAAGTDAPRGEAIMMAAASRLGSAPAFGCLAVAQDLGDGVWIQRFKHDGAFILASPLGAGVVDGTAPAVLKQLGDNQDSLASLPGQVLDLQQCWGRTGDFQALINSSDHIVDLLVRWRKVVAASPSTVRTATPIIVPTALLPAFTEELLGQNRLLAPISNAIEAGDELYQQFIDPSDLALGRIQLEASIGSPRTALTPSALFEACSPLGVEPPPDFALAQGR